MTNLLTDSQLKQFHNDGYIIVKNVLSDAEIEELRKITKDFFTHREDEVVFIYSGKTKSNAFNALPEISKIVENPKVHQIMLQLTNGSATYSHHSDVHFNMLSGWHKDNYGSDDWRVLSGGETYQCYKMAFYLQDHDDNKDGLSVYKGSHLTKDVHNGERVNLPSKAGDAVIFDMRISHVGKEANYFEKGIQVLFKSDKQRFKLLSIYRKLMGAKDKISIFFAFGVPNEFLLEHRDKNIARQNKQNKTNTAYQIHPDVAKSMDRGGIKY